MEEAPAPNTKDKQVDSPDLEKPTTSQSPEIPAPAPTGQKAQVDESKKPRSKKTILIIMIVILAIAGGAYAYYAKNKSKPTTTVNTQTSTQTEPVSVKADSILYYSAAKVGEPNIVYLRPATGGERKAIMTLTGKVDGTYNTISWSDVRGQNAAFATNDGIYVSQDGGNSFKNVYPTDPGHADNTDVVTSLHFSTDNKKVVFAKIDGGNSNLKNTVRAMDLDGKNVADLHVFDAAGVSVYSYNASTQEMVYATGCYFCDGSPTAPHLINVKTGSDKALFTVDDKKDVYNRGSANNDGTKYVYYLGTHNAPAEEESAGPGWQGSPPYRIMELDIASAKSTQIATVGTANEKGTDGKFKLYLVDTGFTTNSTAPYYTADNKLYLVNATKSSLLFEATRDILEVSYASTDEVVARVVDAKATNGDYTLYHYQPASQKSTSIFQGDFNSRVLGVTTK